VLRDIRALQREGAALIRRLSTTLRSATAFRTGVREEARIGLEQAAGDFADLDMQGYAASD